MKVLRSALGASWILALAIAAWQVLSVTHTLDPLFFPPPSKLISTFATLTASGEMSLQIGYTLSRTILGFLSGAALGALFAIPLCLSPWWRHALQPPLSIFYSTPKLTMLPMVMLIFGVNDLSRILLIGTGTFLVVLLQVADAIRGVSREYIELAGCYGASRAAIVRRVYLPACLPQVFTAFRIAFGRALVLTISVELLSCNNGLGNMIWTAWQTFSIDRLYVGVVIASLLGLLFQNIFQWLERRFVPWAEPS